MSHKLFRVDEESATLMHGIGGHVLVLTDVENDEEREELTITYSVWDDLSRAPVTYEWTNVLKVSYSDANARRFIKFIKALDESNVYFDARRWDADGCDERELESCVIGAVFARRWYTDRNGTTRWSPSLYYYTDVKTIQEGRYTVPPALDRRRIQ